MPLQRVNALMGVFFPILTVILLALAYVTHKIGELVANPIASQARWIGVGPGSWVRWVRGSVAQQGSCAQGQGVLWRM